MSNDFGPREVTFKYSVQSVVALYLTGILAATMLLIKPLVVGAVIESIGLSIAEAGLLVAMEMVGMTVAGLFVAAVLLRVDRNRAAYLGLLVALLGQAGAAVVRDPLLLMAMRFTAGLGEGIILSIVFAYFAAAREPDRILSRYYFVALLAGSAQFFIMGLVSQKLGAAGIFAFLAIFMLPVFFLIRAFPAVAFSSSRPSSPMTARIPLAGWVALAGTLPFFIGSISIWAFIERFGVNVGLATVDIGYILGASQVGAAFASLLAAWFVVRYGRTLPIVFGMIAFISCLVMLANSATATMYIVSAVMFNGLWFFQFPLITSVLAAWDPGGRLMVLMLVLQNIGYSLGPAVAGNMLQEAGYVQVVSMAIACLFVSAICFAFGAFKVNQAIISVNAV